MEVKPLNDVYDSDKIKIFLAGTIDNGNSRNWQKEFVEFLESLNEDYIIYNPRRDDWNPNLKPVLSTLKFKQQVQWETENLHNSNIVIFNFLEDSKSPVTFLELGEMVASGFLLKKKFYVICPPNFYRRGNIEHFCIRHKVDVFDSEDDFKTFFKKAYE